MEPQPKKIGVKRETKKKTTSTRTTAAATPGPGQLDSNHNEYQVEESAVPAAEPQNLEAAIALRAYELYQKRGGQGGHELDDWLEAERQVLGR
jgi:hypothetical protein